MARRNPHDISDEPHLTGRTNEVDPSQEAAERQLARERKSVREGEEQARYSVFDEPAMLPGRKPITIGKDWDCQSCGYNLRGLLTGQPCPECGTMPLYEPPRDGEVTYAEWLSQSGRAGTASQLAFVIPLVLFAMAGSVVNAYLMTEMTGFVSFVVFGPAIAEALRAAPAWLLVECRWYMAVQSRIVVVLAVGTAQLFWLIQCIVHIAVLFPGMPAGQLVYRLVVGWAFHTLMSVIIVKGLLGALRRARKNRQPLMGQARRAVIAAAVVHGLVNALVFVRGDFGYGF